MMERAKLQRRLQFLIQLQQLRRLSRAKVKKRRCWVREIFQSRAGYGAFETLFNALRNDRELFFRYICMTPEKFDQKSCGYSPSKNFGERVEFGLKISLFL